MADSLQCLALTKDTPLSWIRPRCYALCSTLRTWPTPPRPGTCTRSGRPGAWRSSSTRGTGRKRWGWMFLRCVTGPQQKFLNLRSVKSFFCPHLCDLEVTPHVMLQVSSISSSTRCLMCFKMLSTMSWIRIQSRATFPCSRS